MEVSTLPRPHIETIALIETPAYVLIRVHEGSSTPQVISDIAGVADPEWAPGWLRPFGHSGPIDLAAIRADPVRALGWRLTSIPALDRCVPHVLRTPWALSA